MTELTYSPIGPVCNDFEKRGYCGHTSCGAAEDAAYETYVKRGDAPVPLSPANLDGDEWLSLTLMRRDWEVIADHLRSVIGILTPEEKLAREHLEMQLEDNS